MVKKTAILLLLLCPAVCLPAKPKPLKRLEVTVDAAGYNRVDAIASLNLKQYELDGIKVEVRRITGSGSAVCVSQLDQTGNSGTLYWRIDGGVAADDALSFEITAVPEHIAEETKTAMLVKKGDDGIIVLGREEKPVLAYNTRMSRLPHGVDPAYSRNGYIHPAWSPSGYVLTDVSPSDHAHHYGFWNPWTSLDYDGEHYDLWNIGDKTGTVLLDSVVSIAAGGLFADLLVAHKHIIFQKQEKRTYVEADEIIEITPKKPVTIINELLDIRVWNAGDTMFVWDFVSDQTPATGLPVVLPAYRYGGFCWRANPEFDEGNVRMLSSEGKTRKNADATNARWILTTADTGKGAKSVLMMSYPENLAHPEPLRIWDSGKVMVNYAPSKFADWTLEPGKHYLLKYRIVTADREITAAEAERLWTEFAHPVKVTVR